MADLLNINMNADEVIAALDEYGDFSVGMTATEFVGEVNTAFPDADAELTDTASELVDKVNNAQPSPSPVIPEGTVLKFLHYSDPHNTKGSTEKAIEVMTAPVVNGEPNPDYDPDIDFVVCSGDIDAYDTAFKAALNASSHLLVNGNHDGRVFASNPSYKALLRGYMENSGVNFGASGELYWYKDYSVQGLPTGAKVRIIGVDEYDGEGTGLTNPIMTNTQIGWIIDRIDELGKNDYLIIVLHQAPLLTADVTTQGKNVFCWTRDWGWDGYNDMSTFLSDVAKAYKHGQLLNKTYHSGAASATKDWTGKTDQATFLGFLCGHVHADIHCGVPRTGYTDLLMMCIDTGKGLGQSVADATDFPYSVRQAANNACINKVTVDFHNKSIRIDRIGMKEVHDQRDSSNVFYRGNIVFDFDANVKSQNGVEEGGES